MKLKPRIEVPSGCSTEEFTRFDELVRLLGGKSAISNQQSAVRSRSRQSAVRKHRKQNSE